MRYVGRITEWNDDRGFGFVVPNGGGQRVFVHVNAFERAQSRPTVGELISYQPIKDAKGRLNAAAIRHVVAQRVAPVATRRTRLKKPLALIFLAVLMGGWLVGKVPSFIAIGYLVVSVLTFIIYAIDKQAAQQGQWRTPESSLHSLALLGGWPGALFAQDLFRHKSKKTEFQLVFWATVIINFVALSWLIGSGNAADVQQMIFEATSAGG